MQGTSAAAAAAGAGVFGGQVPFRRAAARLLPAGSSKSACDTVLLSACSARACSALTSVHRSQTYRMEVHAAAGRRHESTPLDNAGLSCRHALQGGQFRRRRDAVVTGATGAGSGGAGSGEGGASDSAAAGPADSNEYLLQLFMAQQQQRGSDPNLVLGTAGSSDVLRSSVLGFGPVDASYDDDDGQLIDADDDDDDMDDAPTGRGRAADLWSMLKDVRLEEEEEEEEEEWDDAPARAQKGVGVRGRGGASSRGPGKALSGDEGLGLDEYYEADGLGISKQQAWESGWQRRRVVGSGAAPIKLSFGGDESDDEEEDGFMSAGSAGAGEERFGDAEGEGAEEQEEGEEAEDGELRDGWGEPRSRGGGAGSGRQVGWKVLHQRQQRVQQRDAGRNFPRKSKPLTLEEQAEQEWQALRARSSPSGIDATGESYETFDDDYDGQGRSLDVNTRGGSSSKALRGVERGSGVDWVGDEVGETSVRGLLAQLDGDDGSDPLDAELRFEAGGDALEDFDGGRYLDDPWPGQKKFRWWSSDAPATSPRSSAGARSVLADSIWAGAGAQERQGGTSQPPPLSLGQQQQQTAASGGGITRPMERQWISATLPDPTTTTTAAAAAAVESAASSEQPSYATATPRSRRSSDATTSRSTPLTGGGGAPEQYMSAAAAPDGWGGVLDRLGVQQARREQQQQQQQQQAASSSSGDNWGDWGQAARSMGGAGTLGSLTAFRGDDRGGRGARPQSSRDRKRGQREEMIKAQNRASANCPRDGHAQGFMIPPLPTHSAAPDATLEVGVHEGSTSAPVAPPLAVAPLVPLTQLTGRGRPYRSSLWKLSAAESAAAAQQQQEQAQASASEQTRANWKSFPIWFCYAQLYRTATEESDDLYMPRGFWYDSSSASQTTTQPGGYEIRLVQAKEGLAQGISWLRESLDPDGLIGLDCEWPAFGKTELSLIQMATSSRCLLLHVCHFRQECRAPGSPLVELLRDPSLYWAVLGNEDERMLNTEFGAATSSGQPGAAASADEAGGEASLRPAAAVADASVSPWEEEEEEEGAGGSGSSDDEPGSLDYDSGMSGSGSGVRAPSVIAGTVIDVQVAAAECGVLKLGMQDMARFVLGLEGWTKSRKVTKSQWSLPELSAKQIRYAALDALLAAAMLRQLRLDAWASRPLAPVVPAAATATASAAAVSEEQAQQQALLSGSSSSGIGRRARPGARCVLCLQALITPVLPQRHCCPFPSCMAAYATPDQLARHMDVSKHGDLPDTRMHTCDMCARTFVVLPHQEALLPLPSAEGAYTQTSDARAGAGAGAGAPAAFSAASEGSGAPYQFSAAGGAGAAGVEGAGARARAARGGDGSTRNSGRRKSSGSLSWAEPSPEEVVMITAADPLNDEPATSREGRGGEREGGGRAGEVAGIALDADAYKAWLDLEQLFEEERTYKQRRGAAAAAAAAAGFSSGKQRGGAYKARAQEEVRKVKEERAQERLARFKARRREEARAAEAAAQSAASPPAP